jgi:hypothetical protein
MQDGSVAYLTSYAPRHEFQAAGKRLLASIKGVLLGHEDWVHSVAWVPRHQCKAATSPASFATSPTVIRHRCQPVEEQQLQLLTASMDRTIMMWSADRASGLWMCEESVGDAGVLPCHSLQRLFMWPPFALVHLRLPTVALPIQASQTAHCDASLRAIQRATLHAIIAWRHCKDGVPLCLPTKMACHSAFHRATGHPQPVSNENTGCPASASLHHQHAALLAMVLP